MSPKKRSSSAAKEAETESPKKVKPTVNTDSKTDSKTGKNSVAPCLWFHEKNAEAAARFYASIFPDSRVLSVRRAPCDYPGGGKAGDVLDVEFTLFDTPFVGLNGGAADFKFSDAISIQIYTDTQEETDKYWNAIVSNGGSESYCGWCKDKYGLSWQITPRVLMEALGDTDKVAAKRSFDAMCTMRKIDVTAIKTARFGAGKTGPATPTTAGGRTRIAPFLWFDRNALEAAKFFAASLPDSAVTAVHHATVETPGAKAGEVLTVEFTVCGQPFVGMNGGPSNKFSEAVSFMLYTNSQDETDRYWNVLTTNGGAESYCGWAKDRFGLSWQIVPRQLASLVFNAADQASAKRAMTALGGMQKIDLPLIEAAAHNSLPSGRMAYCLWFAKNAETAAKFYASVFPDSGVTALRQSPADFPTGKAGDVVTVEFKILGESFIGINGGPMFSFTPAVSFQVYTNTQEETDRYWNALTTNGGSESKCGWCKDRFGLSWQVVPRQLTTALYHSDTKRSKRVMEAVMRMGKIDIKTVETAFTGDDQKAAAAAISIPADRAAVRIAPCFSFSGKTPNAAEAAAAFWCSLFPDSRVEAVHKSPCDYPGGKAGDAFTVEFTLFGQRMLGLNGGPPDMKFTEALSIEVYTDSQAETDKYWNAIVSNGGAESQCGWCSDRFGLSWQISPRPFLALLNDPDRALAKRAMEAMFQMKRIDIQAAKAAAHPNTGSGSGGAAAAAAAKK